MTTDYIKEIKIDDAGRLCIYPEKERFTLIYRTATEVDWDDKGLFLYSPKPREWSYLDWFKHITNVTKYEVNCELLLADDTFWNNIPQDLKSQILLLA